MVRLNIFGCTGNGRDCRTGIGCLIVVSGVLRGFEKRLTVNLDLFCLRCAFGRISDLKIRFSSSELSASSCFLYSCTVAQPYSDLSASRICFCLSRNNYSPFLISSCAFDISFCCRKPDTSAIVSMTLVLNLN